MAPKRDESPVAVVTGGSRGIGASVARMLAEGGYRVVLTYNTHAFEAEEVVRSIREYGEDAIAVKVDCTNASEVAVLAKHPWCQSGISSLVLNHRVYERWPASQVSPERMSETVEINFLSAHQVWWELDCLMVEGASFVAIGSQLGRDPIATLACEPFATACDRIAIRVTADRSGLHPQECRPSHRRCSVGVPTQGEAQEGRPEEEEQQGRAVPES